MAFLFQHPTNVLGSAGSGIPNTLGADIIGGIHSMLQDVYNKHQAELENKRKADEMAMEHERLKSAQDQQAFTMNRARAQEAEQLALQTPEDQAPVEFTAAGKEPIGALDISTPADKELGTPEQKVTLPTFETKRVPIRTKTYGEGPNAITAALDWGGREAAKRKTEAEQSTWLPIQNDVTIAGQTFKAGTKVPPAVWTLVHQDQAEAGRDERARMLEEGRDRRAAAHEAALLGRQTPSDKKAEKESADAEMIGAVRQDDPESIPIQYRALVLQRAAGRGQVPRGSAYNIVDQLAAAYNGGTSDVGNIRARQDMRKELVKGSPSARGGQVSRINTFAGHLNDLQDANDEINKQLANSDWQSINWLDQKLTRSGKKGPLAAYQQWADTVIGEYTTTLKGGAPTDQDKKDFAKLRDTTTAPAERQAIIDAMKAAIEERANAMESSWKQAFGGKSSVESEQPMFDANYTYDAGAGVWRHSRRGVMQRGTPSAAANPYGLTRKGK